MNPPRIRWVVVYAVASFLVAVSIMTFFKEAGRIERLSTALDSRIEELTETTRKNQELQEKINFYKTPEGIAYLAREEFNLVRPGEKKYRIEIISEDTDALEEKTKTKK
ncbi:MAG: septum formation initiator family protein [Synergistaceae bacterium]|jgi:cell division protein FtsB|nr:septum formation initiator family protein [Synergistaceae bacterium]